MSAVAACKIVFPVGGKGGVGKTAFVKNFWEACVAKSLNIKLIDCDDETSTLTRYLPEARFIPIRSPLEIDGVVHIAIEERPQVLAVDLPARAGEEFQAWFSLVPFDDLRAMGVTFTAVGVVAGSKDSIECILRWREFLRGQVNWVIALNRRDDLSLYLGSNARKSLLSEGVPEIEIPKLDERIATELDRANWTISRALSATEPCYLTQLMTRSRLRRYQNALFTQFDQKNLHLFP
jgi:hypothetical protein